jgi:hypothetical protein
MAASTNKPIRSGSQFSLMAAAKPVLLAGTGGAGAEVVVVEVAGGAVAGDCGWFCAISLPGGVGDEAADGVVFVCAVPVPVPGLAKGEAPVEGEAPVVGLGDVLA